MEAWSLSVQLHTVLLRERVEWVLFAWQAAVQDAVVVVGSAGRRIGHEWVIGTVAPPDDVGVEIGVGRRRAESSARESAMRRDVASHRTFEAL
jgi:hypothetical protein